MNASSVPTMVFVDQTVPGRRLARHALYHHSFCCPPAHPRTTPDLPALARLQPRLYRGDFPAHPLGRFRALVLAVGRVLVAGRGAFPRDHPPLLAALAPH